MMTSILNALRDYRDNPDPLAVVANTVALVVAGNQPFYPLYLHGIVGASAGPAWWTLATMPLFAAIPFVARRHSLIGRVMLPIVGTANGILAAKLVGTESGVELFLLPCALLATLLFRPTERVAMLASLAAPFAAYFLFDPYLGPSVAHFPDGSHRSLVALNAMSVASLLVLIGYVYPKPSAPS
jgi:hypothetical protein